MEDGHRGSEADTLSSVILGIELEFSLQQSRIRREIDFIL